MMVKGKKQKKFTIRIVDTDIESDTAVCWLGSMRFKKMIN